MPKNYSSLPGHPKSIVGESNYSIKKKKKKKKKKNDAPCKICGEKYKNASTLKDRNKNVSYHFHPMCLLSLKIMGNEETERHNITSNMKISDHPVPCKYFSVKNQNKIEKHFKYSRSEL